MFPSPNLFVGGWRDWQSLFVCSVFGIPSNHALQGPLYQFLSHGVCMIWTPTKNRTRHVSVQNGSCVADFAARHSYTRLRALCATDLWYVCVHHQNGYFRVCFQSPPRIRRKSLKGRKSSTRRNHIVLWKRMTWWNTRNFIYDSASFTDGSTGIEAFLYFGHLKWEAKLSTVCVENSPLWQEWAWLIWLIIFVSTCTSYCFHFLLRAIHSLLSLFP